MAVINYLDQVSEFLINKPSGLEFEKIINHLIKRNQFSEEQLIDINDLKAEIYSDMILDNRFFLFDNGKWSLRDKVSLASLKKHFNESEVGNRSIMLNTAHFDDTQLNISESKVSLTSEIEEATYINHTRETTGDL